MHHERRNMNENNSNGLQTIITQVIEEMKSEQGDKFDINRINLAEMERRTGMTRAQLRRLKKNDFQITPHALTGRKADTTIISGYTGVIDDLLKKGVSNSEVILERIQEQGFQGSLTTVKRYIQSHKYLIPPKRQTVAPQGNRGRRYSSDAGESYQMDWGFVNVDTGDGTSYKVACFAMICHHCGERYIEFFPNAKQENLFIGMIHAFKRMGVPGHVLTDNMKSVVLHRDSEGHPVWNHDYEAFMNTIGFETKLCRPRHPFTKGSVERLVRFVKENFLAGRVFGTITDLNYEAWKWCDNQNNRYHKAVDCIPHERHSVSCIKNASILMDMLWSSFFVTLVAKKIVLINLCCRPCFIWGSITIITVWTNMIIINVCKFFYLLIECFLCCKLIQICAFILQGIEVTLHRCIVVRISCFAHALCHIYRFAEFGKCFGRIL